LNKALANVPVPGIPNTGTGARTAPASGGGSTGNCGGPGQPSCNVTITNQQAVDTGPTDLSSDTINQIRPNCGGPQQLPCSTTVTGISKIEGTGPNGEVAVSGNVGLGQGTTDAMKANNQGIADGILNALKSMFDA